MTTAKPSDSRYTIKTTADDLHIEIPSNRSLGRLAGALVPIFFLASLFVFFLVGPLVQQGNTEYSPIGPILCGPFWAFIVIFLIRDFLWLLRGHEQISINNQHVTITRTIMRSQHTIPVSEVRSLTINYETSRWLNQSNIPEGTLLLETPTESVRFGVELTEAEAKQIIKHMIPYLPEISN